MTWEDTRGASRVVVTGVRQVAHADDAKSRVDEASRLPTKSLRPRVLVGAGAAVVVLALIAFLMLRGGEDTTDRAALTKAPVTPSASTPIEPTAAEVLRESAPSGVFKLVIVGVSSTTRGGQTTPLKDRSDPVKWTLPVADCSDTQCSGTISSSSGRTFPFTWDGRRLLVALDDSAERDKKRACVDIQTGEVRPIETSAARLTWHYHYGPFTGSPERFVSRSVTRTTYEFFGDCEPQPGDDVKAVYEWRMTAVQNG